NPGGCHVRRNPQQGPNFELREIAPPLRLPTLASCYRPCSAALLPFASHSLHCSPSTAAQRASYACTWSSVNVFFQAPRLPAPKNASAPPTRPAPASRVKVAAERSMLSIRVEAHTRSTS